MHSHGCSGLNHGDVSWSSPAEDEKLALRLQREEYEAQKRYREMLDQPISPHRVSLNPINLHPEGNQMRADEAKLELEPQRHSFAN